MSKIQLNDYLKIETQTFKNENIANDENIVDILKTLKEIYENHWKDINKINTSIKLPLTISLTANNYKKILHFEKVLDDLDLLFSYEVLSFNNKKIYYKLIYNGSPNRFLSDLELRNITVDTQDQEWKIK